MIKIFHEMNDQDLLCDLLKMNDQDLLYDLLKMRTMIVCVYNQDLL